ncbi:hypothetical protein ACIP2X_20195 [Streptomyces sp. NPDC089424]|uniref:hypothetical protein n=1 Tax=Streptomyces sp. NPDC089424 TaxID=3365917 RepID=UPI0038156E5E
MPRPELSELDHLREIERLARAVAAAALDAGHLSYAPDPDDATPLQRAVNALAREIRHHHFPGDGCLPEEDRPTVRLAGVVLLRPAPSPPATEETYETACARLGVEARAEGWAQWNTWGSGGARITMVVSSVDTTLGLLANWARGRDVYPVRPLPSQVALVRQGWAGPMTLSPWGAARLDLTDQWPTPAE